MSHFRDRFLKAFEVSSLKISRRDLFWKEPEKVLTQSFKAFAFKKYANLDPSMKIFVRDSSWAYRVCIEEGSGCSSTYDLNGFLEDATSKKWNLGSSRKLHRVDSSDDLNCHFLWLDQSLNSSLLNLCSNERSAPWQFWINCLLKRLSSEFRISKVQPHLRKTWRKTDLLCLKRFIEWWI